MKINGIEKNKKRIIVAMSGGLDSSVAAALLKKQGYFVIGVFMKFWHSHSEIKENRCCSLEAEKRARKIAQELNMPFYVLNCSREFKKKVVDYFLEEYRKRGTPNPCVICNKEIKFGFLIKKALEAGADFVATGHYARKVQEPRSRFQKSNPKKIYKLLKAKDKEKDQSYFLWRLNQRQLSRILFPVGDYTKKEVKALARKFKLPVLDIPESQEICFIGNSINSFLKKYLKEKKGDIVDLENKKKIGEHNGLWFYTIGQRKGIKSSYGPYYVVKKDFKKNLLFVSKNKKDLFKKKFIVKEVNWISGKCPKMPLEAKVKIRSRHKPRLALIKKTKKGCQIKFQKPQSAITPGQSAVFYNNNELIGGGIIVKVV